MDFIRRKYLIYSIENNIDFFRNELMEKISNFSLNHILAINYIIKKYHKIILTKDLFASTNFYIFLHFVRDYETYDILLNTSFDITLLYLKQLIKNYSVFISYINTYKEYSKTLLDDFRFLYITKITKHLHDTIGINYNTELNPLFHANKPIKDLEIIFTKLFRETKFIKVNAYNVLRLVLWMYSLKNDTGLEFSDNDNQDMYTILQNTGPIINSDITEQYKNFIFSDKLSVTSYWVFLKYNLFSDDTIYTTETAITMYQKLLCYIYSELKYGRVNKNMLKLIYIFDNNPDIRKLLLEQIYNIPKDILAIIDEQDEEWKSYFIDFYKKNFIDGKTITPATFYTDLFNIVALIDPSNFVISRDIQSIFTTDPTTIARFDEMKINTTYVSQMVYQNRELDLLAIEENQLCQIYNADSEYIIREYNTYLYLEEEDPLIVYRGQLTKLSNIDIQSPNIFFSLFSKNIIKYFLDSCLARIGLIINNYQDNNIILKIIMNLTHLKNFNSFIIYATSRDQSILKAVIRNIINNLDVILMFKPFLQDNMYYVREYLSIEKHLSKNEKKYIIQIIEGR